jgi:hypothetical protein
MTSRGRVVLVPLLLWLASGCAGPGPDGETIAESRLAVNACDETVPSDRLVDGLPAYAQCSAVENGNIWSNNGVDTSATSLGDDWIQTQRGGGYQCTEWAYRYMHFRWGVDYRHGNAQEWCDGELPSTLVKAQTPVHGDLIVFAGGVCGSDETTGHIAVIDVVDTTAAKVTFVEENRAGRRTANQSCGSCFLHAVANDGSAAGAAGSGGSGGASGASGAGGTTAGQGGLSAQGGSPGLGGRATAGGTAGTAASGGTSGALNGTSGAKFTDAGQGGASSGGRGTVGQAGTSPASGAAGGAGGSTMDGAGGRAAAAGAASSGSPGVAGGTAAEEPPLVLDELSTDSGGGCTVTRRRGTANGWSAIALALLLGAARGRRQSRARL